MKNKMSQAGFTLIELIAVMVILGILAAVIIPRISTLTSGAYESNVRSMYGVIKNEVSAQAVKAAMSGGAGGHREKFPQIDDSNDDDYYLTEWVDEFDTDMWSSTEVNNAIANINDKDGTTDVDVLIFTYAPHGISSGDKEDKYHIYYAAITTTRGDANGYDYDGYVMWASQDANLNGTGDARVQISAAGAITATAGSDEIISDLTFIASP